MHSSQSLRLSGSSGIRAVACVLALVAIAVLTLVAAPHRAGAQAATAERLIPPDQTVGVGGIVTTDVTVENVPHLGAYEAVILYDSALVTFLSATNGPFIASSGRTVFCPPPVISVIAGTLRQARFGCVTSGAAPPGPSGSGLLATATWQTVAAGDASLTLTPSLADELGNAIATTAFSAVVHIVSGPTPTATSTSTPTASPTPCPGPCPTNTPSPTSTFTPAATATPGDLCGAGAAAVCVYPANGGAGHGTTFDVPVAAAQVNGLAAFQLTMAYDPALVTAVGATSGPFMSSTGRTVLCLSPSFTPGALQLTCVTLSDAPPAPNGSGVIALFSFSADGDGTTAIALQSVKLSGLFGNPIGAAVIGGARTIAPCSGACPTATPTSTATASATPTSTRTETATATPCSGTCPTATFSATPTSTSTTAPTSTPGPLTLRVSPPVQSVTQGSGVVIDVTADGVADLGAYEVGLTYDPSLLSFVTMNDGALLGSTGRTVSCPSSSTGAGTVRLGCVTLGPSPAGANGGGVLARFTFNALAPGTTTLTLSTALIATRFGTVLPVVSTVGGSMTVNGCAGTCPTATPTSPAGTPTATPGPGGAVISVEPAARNVSVGDVFSVDVRIANASNVAASDVLLRYGFDDNGAFEPNVLELVDVTAGPFLGSTGRPVTCLTPLVDLLTVRFGCVTSGATPPGASGAGLLATVRFRVLKTPFRPMIIGVDGSAGGPSDPSGDGEPFSSGGFTTVTIGAPSGMIAAGTVRDDNAGGGARSSGLLSSIRSLPSKRQTRTLVIAMLAIGAMIALSAKSGRRRAWFAAAACATGAAALVALPSHPPHTTATAPMTIGVSPASVNAFAGGAPARVDVAIDAVPAPGLRSFELEASFNSAAVSVSASEGPFLASTGNTTVCVTDYPSASQVRLSCTDGSANSGPTGDGVLASFEVQPRTSLDLRGAPMNALLTSLDVSDIIVRDTSGIATSFAQPLDAVIAVRALEGDVNHDCVVNVADSELITSHYYRGVAMPGYLAALDIEPSGGDGDIDLNDVQVVLGRIGSTCTAPSPPQGPPVVPAVDARDTDGDGCPDAREASVAALDMNDPWDFFSVPVPALFAATDPQHDFRDGAVTAGDAQAAFAYFKAGAQVGQPVYEQDLNGNGILDGIEYDRRIIAPARTGPPDGAVTSQDAQVAFAQFRNGLHC